MKRIILIYGRRSMMQRAIMMKEKLKIKNVIIALKTLATEFRDGGKMEDNIEEMTSFFFLPLCVTRTGKLCMPVEGKYLGYRGSI